jgi:predicted PurR-regulated permease PerM
LQNFIGSGIHRRVGFYWRNILQPGLVSRYFGCHFFFLKDSAKLQNWFVELAPPEYHNDARRYLQELNRIWSAYLRGQITLM